MESQNQTEPLGVEGENQSEINDQSQNTDQQMQNIIESAENISNDNQTQNQKPKHNKKKLGLWLLLSPIIGVVTSLIFIAIIKAVKTLLNVQDGSLIAVVISFSNWLFVVIGVISIIGFIVGIPLGIIFLLSGKEETREVENNQDTISSERMIDVFEILDLSWKKFKENAKLLLIITLFFIVVRIVGSIAQKMVEESYVAIVLVVIITATLNIMIAIGITQILLKISRGSQTNFGEILGGKKYFWRFIVGNLLYGLIVFAGFILLVIPGIIWQYKYSMFSYLIIDKDMQPMEALKESGRIMNGNKWKLFFLQILMLPVIITGFLFFGVGIFVAIPVVTLMSVAFYRIVVGEKVTA